MNLPNPGFSRFEQPGLSVHLFYLHFFYTGKFENTDKYKEKNKHHF